MTVNVIQIVKMKQIEYLSPSQAFFDPTAISRTNEELREHGKKLYNHQKMYENLSEVTSEQASNK